jgi:hypothetical protein
MNDRPIDDPASAGWHLDKRVPIALIITMVLQFLGFAWFGGQLAERVTQLENARMAAGDQPGKIVRLETQVDNVRETLKDISLKLDRLLEKSQP